ncbi:DNA primase [Candidatus Woesebacteria bacterium]|jgi:DNA primase|nr:DNA primase [Candidatus Woesebacteria bacterium]HOA12085.1 DNA primase [Candidatus Woesebacteria bacterium]HOP39126.1 DNA primase [Candidatus Woesebacteria bacterium]HPA61843.1 DNA primase [Candidatus Woesebacteria bacterium]HPK08193.1 DNA primase [Candidatus Woesebacteria bacterium]
MSQIQEVKDANNIVEIVGEKIDLRPSGSSFKARCPFHSEKTPSFFVHPEMQRYRCFGCGATGDVLDFLQNYDGMTFYEALKYLADRASITLKDFNRTSEDEEREQLLGILNLAKEYYHYLLTQHEAGKPALAYLKERGTNSQSIKLFNLGYSLSSWDGLIKYLHQKKKYPLELIAKTGLIIKGKGDRYYDRFRGRVMFPLKNHRGQVVGFSGRLLTAQAKEAKYINSPETSLYHKSKLLYGYSELFREIRKANKVVVVEGEFDVISSAQAHVNNVVAIKGSALTADQVDLLARVSDSVILAFDADEAGINACKRAITLMKDKDIDLRVIDFPALHQLATAKDLKDPDDFARQEPKLWRQAVDQAISIYSFLLNTTLAHYDAETPDGKRKIIDELAPIINGIDHLVEKEFYLQKLSEKLNVKLGLIKEDIARVAEKKNKKTTVVKVKPPIEPNKQKAKSHQEIMEEYLLFLLFHLEKDAFEEGVNNIIGLKWQTPGLSNIVDILSRELKNFDLEKFSKRLAEDLKAILMEILLNPEFEKNIKNTTPKKEWQRVLEQVKKNIVHSEIEAINQEINELDKKNQRTKDEEQRLDQLLEQIVQMQRQLKS